MQSVGEMIFGSWWIVIPLSEVERIQLIEVMRICQLHIEIAYMLYNLSFGDLLVFLALSF